MFRKRIDLVGKKFGELTVIKLSDKTYNNVQLWECKCNCNNSIYVSSGALNSGDYKSCGCDRHIRRSESVSKYAQSQIIDGTRESALKRRTYKNNKSGHKGINWDNKRKKWRVTIGISGKQLHVGYFDNKDEAIAARKEAVEQYHKPYLE